ncbi:LytS/YhcK type 5TM receptor domain-containing protein [Paenibacillus sedimenti]|uniref:Histidine kinase n=1 Tax=Paenibacillus sedimenti TaxID=2770274 RepID=A0A926KLC9_9BACL|nr:LytS/YhcK type 5TM receptor domain-containing protein [Paenibacillus sedimenti]MBD0378906.1 histidine kinase [Paenibacillus sedimenti]
MLQLFVDMIERVGFLIALAFAFSRSRWMRSYMSYQGDKTYQWRFLFFFTAYAILATYSGVTVTEYSYRPAPWIGEVSPTAAIANSRTVGVVIAGLLGGAKSGLIVGIAAGLHRYSLGGFVAFACMIAPILQGFLAGLCRNAFKKRFRKVASVQLAFLVGFMAEALQMALILALARPWESALNLVALIGLPQMLANGVGVALYFVLYNTMEREEDRIGAEHANKALQIADMTLPLWRLEFNMAVREIAKVLNEEMKAAGAFFSKDGSSWIAEGRKTKYGIDLFIGSPNQRPIGQFRLYFEREQEDNPYRRRMLASLAGLLSQQYAFVESERQTQLLADAEIRSLQAQMNPHFLFNVLNTVKSFIRTKPEEARQLVMHLSKFLRKNMGNGNQRMITIRDEYELVISYLSLNKSRLGDQLEFSADIDESILDHQIPPFTIQPLVENAIVHGIKNIEGIGVIRLSVKEEIEGGVRHARVTVEDNGVGLETARLQNGEEHAGMALRNIEQRLSYHYGKEHPLEIDSKPGAGTRIRFWVR